MTVVEETITKVNFEYKLKFTGRQIKEELLNFGTFKELFKTIHKIENQT